MLGNSSAGRPVAGQDEEAAGSRRRPTSVGSNPYRQPRLPIEGDDSGLKVRNDRLHLDDESDPGRLVVAEKIDRASLAEDVERHLNSDVPAEASEPAGHLLHEKGMVGVQQPVESFAVPAQAQIDAGAQCAGDRLEGTQRELVEVTSFNAGNGAPRQPGGDADIDLSPAAATAECAYRASDADRIHDAQDESWRLRGTHLPRKSGTPGATAATTRTIA